MPGARERVGQGCGRRECRRRENALGRQHRHHPLAARAWISWRVGSGAAGLPLVVMRQSWTMPQHGEFTATARLMLCCARQPRTQLPRRPPGGNAIVFPSCYFRPGGYRFLPGVGAFSSGTRRHARPRDRPRHARRAGSCGATASRASTATCAQGPRRRRCQASICGARSPSLSTASRSSNEGYRGLLGEWGILLGKERKSLALTWRPCTAAFRAVALRLLLHLAGQHPGAKVHRGGRGPMGDRARQAGRRGIIRHGDTSAEGMRREAW